MSLRQKIHKGGSARSNRQQALFGKYGVFENPFPAAGQPSGHPHLDTDVDQKIVECIQEFVDSYKTQVLVIEPTFTT
jgi:hypothetical protein